MKSEVGINLDFTSAIGALALAQVLLLCLYLVVLYPRNKTAWLFTSLLIVMVIALGHDLLLHTQLAIYVPQVLGMGPFHSFLVGPLVLLLIIKLINPAKPLSFWHGLHFVPFIVQQISRIDILFQPADSKRERLIKYFSELKEQFEPVAFNWATFSDLLAFYGHRFLYFFIALFLLHQGRSMFEHAVPSRALMRKPLFYLLTTYCLCWLLIRLALFTEEWSFAFQSNVAMINSVGLSILSILLAITLFKHPFGAIFSGQSTQKYKRSVLDDETGKSLVDELKNQLLMNRLFAVPDIKQSDLAQKMGISSQLLSQAMTQQKDGKFNDVLNAMRIEYFKQLIQLPENKDKDIQFLALESGFSSKATFYRVFKEQVGITPVQYKRSLQVEVE